MTIVVMIVRVWQPISHPWLGVDWNRPYTGGGTAWPQPEFGPARETDHSSSARFRPTLRHTVVGDSESRGKLQHHGGKVMPYVNVKVIENAFLPEEKAE